MNMKLSEKFRSLLEGAVKRKAFDWGSKKDFIKPCKKLPRSFFLRKNDSPLEDGAKARIKIDMKIRLGAPHEIDRNNQITFYIIS